MIGYVNEVSSSSVGSARARSRSLAAELVKRAKVILMLAAGQSYAEIGERLGCTDRYISLWKKRFKQERLMGLDSRYRGAEHRRRTAQTEARILELTRRGPTDGSTHWSSYRLAKEVGVSQSTVSRVWRQFGLQPHRSRSYMVSVLTIRKQSDAVKSQRVTDVVQTDGVSQLREQHADHVTPCTEGSRHGIPAGLARKLRDQMVWNQIAKLPQNSELGDGWFGISFHHSVEWQS